MTSSPLVATAYFAHSARLPAQAADIVRSHRGLLADSRN